MNRTYYPPTVTIDLPMGEDEDGNKVTRELEVGYYADSAEPSVGYGGQFSVEELAWVDNPNEPVSDEIWEREKEIEELAEEACLAEADAAMEP